MVGKLRAALEVAARLGFELVERPGIRSAQLFWRRRQGEFRIARNRPAAQNVGLIGAAGLELVRPNPAHLLIAPA